MAHLLNKFLQCNVNETVGDNDDLTENSWHSRCDCYVIWKPGTLNPACTRKATNWDRKQRKLLLATDKPIYFWTNAPLPTRDHVRCTWMKCNSISRIVTLRNKKKLQRIHESTNLVSAHISKDIRICPNDINVYFYLN